MTDNVAISLIGAMSSVLLAAIAAGASIINIILSRRQGIGMAEVKVGIAETKQTLATLEQNTNGMSTTLVKLAGDKGFQKGLDIGIKAAIGPPGEVGPQGEPGPQGEKGSKG